MAHEAKHFFVDELKTTLIEIGGDTQELLELSLAFLEFLVYVVHHAFNGYFFRSLAVCRVDHIQAALVAQHRIAG